MSSDTGTFACSICGKDNPHHHNPLEVQVFRDVEAWAEEGVRQARPIIDLTDRCQQLERGLADLVALLADTGFHNSIEMAAARRLLAQGADE